MQNQVIAQQNIPSENRYKKAYYLLSKKPQAARHE